MSGRVVTIIKKFSIAVGVQHEVTYRFSAKLDDHPSYAWLLKSFGLYVLEVENPRSEIWLEIKILFYKSTLGNTKMAPELELDAKWNIFIGDINRFQANLRFSTSTT